MSAQRDVHEPDRKILIAVDLQVSQSLTTLQSSPEVAEQPFPALLGHKRVR